MAFPALSFGSVSIAPHAPQGGGDARAVFTSLCDKFKLDHKVAAHLVEVGLESLDDFVHFFTTEQEVGSAVIHKIDGLPNPGVQTARLRSAWAAAKQALAVCEYRKRRGVEEDDMDALLPEHTLNDIEEQFYARHRRVLVANPSVLG